MTEFNMKKVMTVFNGLAEIARKGAAEAAQVQDYLIQHIANASTDALRDAYIDAYKGIFPDVKF
jgi:hypothetical protein